MRHLSVFSGIGGDSLGLKWAGMETVAFCENDKKCQLVLKKHWPGVPIFDDIRELNAEKIKRLYPIDIVSGGFPCQGHSLAGKRKGKADDRYLWPEYFRLIQEIGFSWVIVENVTGIISDLVLDQVLSDLESEAYTCQTLIIPACGIGARHIRNRVWILAHADKERLPKFQRQKKKFKGTGLNRRNLPHNWRKWNPFNSFIRRGNDGVPGRVDRLKQLGNAVVPQIVEIIGRAIMEIEKE